MTQKVSSGITCQTCNKKSKNNYFEQFYKCLKCSDGINNSSTYYCSQHYKTHGHAVDQTVKYDEKCYYCSEHCLKLESYCINCDTNLCRQCENHKNHKIESFGEMMSKIHINDIKDSLTQIKEKIISLRAIVNKIKEMVDGAYEIIEKYYEIGQDILQKYEKYNTELKNYQVIKTLEYLAASNVTVMKDLDDLIKGNTENKDWEKKCSQLINIYKKDRTIFESGKNRNSITPSESDEISSQQSDNGLEKKNGDKSSLQCKVSDV